MPAVLASESGVRGNCAAKDSDFFHRQTKAVHAGINMDGGIRWFSDVARNRAPELSLFHGIDYWLELRAQQHAFIARGWAIEHINRGVGTNTVSQEFTLGTAPRP